MMMAICSTRAYTIESVTTNYSSFTAAITVFTNKPVIQASNLFKYTVGKAKISNKQLLTLFSSWVFTNAPGTNSWPLGARLIFDWDSYQVCVADVSGTNILMHCLDDLRAYALGTNYVITTHKKGRDHTIVTTTNIVIVTNTISSRYFQVDWFKTSGAVVGTSLDANPGYDKWGMGTGASFRLHDEGVTGYTDLQGDGGNFQTFSQTWDASGNGLVWKDKESAKFYYSGDNTLVNSSNATVSASLSASGFGKGFNPAMY
ncbi:MAG TPA: hypothetical protein VN625_09485 [Desulfuromonadaceae bacterium]|nr:hypothetical protein [Desulfuromonadaceae bacterium]